MKHLNNGKFLPVLDHKVTDLEKKEISRLLFVNRVNFVNKSLKNKKKKVSVLISLISDMLGNVLTHILN